MKVVHVCTLFALGCVMAGCDYAAITDPPITITLRHGFLSRYVMRVSNLSAAKGVEIYMYVADANRSARSGNVVVPANSVKEFGAIELDWEFKKGDRGFVRSPRHARELCFELLGEGRYRTWFGHGEIPEVDVAAQVRMKEIAAHTAWLKMAMAAECQRGRELFCAIERANAEREAAGLGSVWPTPTHGTFRSFAEELSKAKKIAVGLVKGRGGAQTSMGRSASDISEMKFKTSGKYFECLFGVGRFASEVGKPYVSGVGVDAAVCGGQTNGTLSAESIRWSVLADCSRELSDDIPALVSANFPCERLRAFWDGAEDAKDVIPLLAVGETKDESFVIVYRNGRVKSFLAAEATLENIYPGAFNTCTNGYNQQIQYITPRGVVKASGMSK